MDVEQKTLATKEELDKAVEEGRQQGEITARKEIGEWIETTMLSGPKENPYTAFFQQLAKRLKEGKRL